MVHERKVNITEQLHHRVVDAAEHVNDPDVLQNVTVYDTQSGTGVCRPNTLPYHFTHIHTGVTYIRTTMLCV
jgi:hypothetical protein